jgi:ribosome-associated protein
MPLLRITDAIAIDESELEERFVQASGPGGQNVNKVATAVQLRFDVAAAPCLPEPVKRRIKTLAGRRMTADGVLVIDARRFRTQERNRADARERLVEMIRRAAIPVAKRIPTRPTIAAKRRRLDAKKIRSTVKRARTRPLSDD